ncbi:MAG: c-type cytochrome [Pseudomonadota bacterium]
MSKPAGAGRSWAVGVVLATIVGWWPMTVSANGYEQLVGHGGPVKGAAVSGDGRYALTASFDYTLGLWDLDSGDQVHWLDAHEAAANTAAFLPDGRRAISGGDDFDLVLWDLETGGALQRLEGHKGKVLSVAVSPDGALAASASWDGSAGLWSLETGELLTLFAGHVAGVNDVAFSPDGALLYTASTDGSLRSWRLSDGELIRIEASHGFGINLVTVDPAGAWIAYGSTDGVVRILSTQTGEELAQLTGDRRPILGLALSPDAKTLAFGDGEGFITIVATKDWRIVRDFRAAARGPIWSLAFADNDSLIASGLDDYAAIWPVGFEGDPLFAEDARRFLVDPDEVSNGERQFARKCSVCHTLETDGKRRAGPTLFGVFGRKAGTLHGYNYSEALLGATITWSPETLDKLFDIGPDYYTPGSKMPMQRIVDPADRQDLIEFLRAATAPPQQQ